MPQVFPALQARGPNVLAALASAETIKSRRLGNRLSEQEITANESAATRRNALDVLGPGIASGDPESIRAAAILDPAETKAIQDAVAPLDAAGVAAAKERAQAIIRELKIIDSRPPEQQQAAYEEGLDRLSRQGIEIPDAPPQFTPQLFEDTKTRLFEFGKVLKEKEAGFTLGQGQTRFEGDQPIASVAPTPKAGFVPVDAESAGLAPGTVAQRNTLTGAIEVVQRPESASRLVTVNSRDAQGNLVTELVDPTTGETVRQVGAGPSVQFQPPQTPGTKKEFEELRSSEIATRQALATARDMIEQVSDRPDLLSVSGALARGAVTLAAQAEGLARVAGIEFDTEPDAERFSGVLGRLGGIAAQSAELRSAVVNLAFAAAAASGQTNRAVSDRDVERFIREIGAGTGSPETFVATLQSFMKRLDRNFQIRSQVITGNAPGSLLGEGFSPSGGPSLSDDLLARHQQGETIEAEEFRQLLEQDPDGFERLKRAMQGAQ